MPPQTVVEFHFTSQDKAIKKVKDLAAAIILFGAIISVVVELLIFLPKLFLLL
ncbi:MAG: diacylglycerol kinase [Lentimicrobiaceae bacterium]|nr:diacylglycerol kinase [Lentimicrobiaceae bacterium]